MLLVKLLDGFGDNPKTRLDLILNNAISDQELPK